MHAAAGHVAAAVEGHEEVAVEGHEEVVRVAVAVPLHVPRR